jgi:predicted dehydrogenase
MMDTVRVGVIGSGYWGPNLIRNFVEIPHAEVVVVADRKEERRDYITSRHPKVQVTDDHTDLYSMGLDAVVVATPPETHYNLAKQSLENGLHTLVEKPLTLRSDHAEELVRLAGERNLTLMVGHTFEYNAAVRKLKEIVDSNELGKVLYVDSSRVNLGLFQRNLNVLWDLAPHDISILLYLFGEMPLTATAQGADCIFDGKHDLVYVHLRFPGDVLAHVHVSWLDPNKERRITVVGDQKMLVFDDVEMLDKIKIFDKGVEVPKYTDSFGEFHCSYRYGDVYTPHIDFSEPLRVECEHFLDSILTGKAPQSDGVSGLNVIKVLEAAEQSLQNGGMTVPVPKFESAETLLGIGQATNGTGERTSNNHTS